MKSHGSWSHMWSVNLHVKIIKIISTQVSTVVGKESLILKRCKVWLGLVEYTSLLGQVVVCGVHLAAMRLIINFSSPLMQKL